MKIVAKLCVSICLCVVVCGPSINIHTELELMNALISLLASVHVLRQCFPSSAECKPETQSGESKLVICQSFLARTQELPVE